jgi:hypothetical protein
MTADLLLIDFETLTNRRGRVKGTAAPEALGQLLKQLADPIST